MIKTVTSATAALLAALALPAMGADQTRTQDQTRDQDQMRTQQQTGDQQQIYGSQMMSEQERNEFRTRMRSAKTDQERDQIRREHHTQMQIRAKERGITLPDEPPQRGMGGGMGGGGMGGGR